MLAAAFISHYTIDDITKLAVACSQPEHWLKDNEILAVAFSQLSMNTG